MEIHTLGNWGRTTLLSLIGLWGRTQGPLGPCPIVGRVPREKLHLRMQGRRGR